MSIGIALNSAISGLNVAQQQLGVSANNISNSDTEGFTRKEAALSAVVVAGLGQGVEVSAVERTVDIFFQNASRNQLTNLGKSSSVSEAYERMKIFYGQPDARNSVAALMNDFFGSLSALANNPERAFFRADAVSKAKAFTEKISGLARSLEQTRFEIDKEIKQDFDFVNAQLAELQIINVGIQESASLGQSTAALFDKRDLALDRIAEKMDVNIITDDLGRVSVSLPRGAELLNFSTRFEIDYSTLNSVDSFINDTPTNAVEVFAVSSNGVRIPGGQVIVPSGVPGQIADADIKISNGTIKGRLELRDKLLPNLVEQLDQLAATLRNEFNKIHNDGAGFPPSNALTGGTSIKSTDVHTFSGEVMVAVVNSDGTPPPARYTGEPNTPPLTLRLAELDSGNGFGKPDISTIVDEINRYYGPATNKATLGPVSKIDIAARTDVIADSTNFTFDLDLTNSVDNSVNVQVTAVSVDGGAGAVITALPTNFDLKAGEIAKRTGSNGGDIQVTFDAGGSPHDIQLTVQVTDSKTGQVFTDTITYTLNNAASGARNQRYFASSVGVGPAAIVTPSSIQTYAQAEIVDASGNPVTAGSSGFLRIRTISDTTRGVAIDELTSKELGVLNNEVATKTDRGFSHFFGLNNFFVENATVNNSAVNLKVRSDILNSPGKISTGELVLSKPPADPAAAAKFSYELSSGGNQVINRLASLQNAGLTFGATATLTGLTVTLSSYTSEIYGYVTAQTLNAEQQQGADQLISDGLIERKQAADGTNIDEELANTIKTQNLYQASARMISIARDSLQDLLGVLA